MKWPNNLYQCNSNCKTLINNFNHIRLSVVNKQIEGSNVSNKICYWNKWSRDIKPWSKSKKIKSKG